jgi:hypothetical protein
LKESATLFIGWIPSALHTKRLLKYGTSNRLFNVVWQSMDACVYGVAKRNKIQKILTRYQRDLFFLHEIMVRLGC